jgi:hypothetical protein
MIPFDGVRSTASAPPIVPVGALAALSRCTPPPGSRAFPAPLVHTPLGPGGARAPPPRGGKSAACNDTAGVLAEWLREPPLRVDGRVGCNVGFGLRPTAQSGRGGSGCCEEVVREEEEVDDCDVQIRH